MAKKAIVLGNLPLATKIIKIMRNNEKVKLLGSIHPSDNRDYDSPFDEECAYSYCKKEGIRKLEYNDVESIEDIGIGISARHNKILDKWFLDKFSLGVVNCHGGYLPEYKGVGGHIFPIINDEAYTGASIHWMDERVDHGALIGRRKIKIKDHDTGISLYFRINKILADLIRDNIKEIISGDADGKPQSTFDVPNDSYPKVKYKKDAYTLLNKNRKSQKEKRALFWPSKQVS